MAAITWDESGKRFFETGVKHGVLYPQASDGSYPLGVAWNGLTSVTESPSGAEPTALWADDQKYLNLVSAEEFGATIEAYTYPDEFAVLDGSAKLGGIDGLIIGQQDRGAFGLCYTTVIGNDIKGNGYGEKIHLIYGAMASPSERAYSTINDSPEAITFSWEISTTPVEVGVANFNHKPTACLTIDTTKFTTTEAKAKLDALKDALFGTDTGGTSGTGTDPYLPLPADVLGFLD